MSWKLYRLINPQTFFRWWVPVDRPLQPIPLHENEALFPRDFLQVLIVLFLQADHSKTLYRTRHFSFVQFCILNVVVFPPVSMSNPALKGDDNRQNMWTTGSVRVMFPIEKSCCLILTQLHLVSLFFLPFFAPAQPWGILQGLSTLAWSSVDKLIVAPVDSACGLDLFNYLMPNEWPMEGFCFRKFQLLLKNHICSVSVKV